MNFKNDNFDSPIHINKSTPPTKGKVRNPFDKVLIEKLHKPICRYVTVLNYVKFF